MKKTKSLKRILAGALAALMSLSAIPVAFAATGPVLEERGDTYNNNEGVDMGKYVSMFTDNQKFTFIQTQDNEEFEFDFWFNAKKNAGVNYGYIPGPGGSYPQTFSSPVGKNFSLTWVDGSEMSLPGTLFGGNNWISRQIIVKFVGDGGKVYNTALHIDYDSGSTSGSDRAWRSADISMTITVLDKRALNSAIAEAEGVENTGVYTEDSWQNFQNALAQAQSIGGNVIVDQTTIDQSTNNLIGAMADLIAKDASYTALNAAIADAETILNEDDVDRNYDADALAALRTAYDAAKAIAPGLDITHQDEIDAAATTLASAVAAMVKLADYSGVAQAISVYEKLNGRYFDADDLAAVTELVAAARDEMTNNRRPATEQSAVDAMAVEILNAISDLKMLPADYAALDTLVDTATEIYLSSDNVYTVDSIKALEAALLAAMDVQDADYTIDKQNLVDEAYNALDTAMKTMVKLPADTTTLEQFIEDAIEMTQVSDYETYYTADSRAALEAALAQAQALLEQELTIDDEAAVAAAAKKLADAMVQMDVVLADYSELEAAIKARTQELEIARTAVTEDGDPLYKAASLARLESMIKAAGTIDHTLSIRDQQIVDDAVTMLNSYQLEKNAADTVALKALIAEKQDALNNASDEYTTESKEALQAAISAANAVIAANYDITMQWRVDEAYKTLEAVELVLKGADYAKVDAAIDAAEKFLADEENQAIYTQEALQMIQDALDAANGIDRGAYTIRDQEAVDAFATAIDNAIAAADGSYNPADKQALADAIDAAKAKLEAEDINDYTDASIEALKAAIADAEAYLEQDLDITDNDEIAAKAEALGAMELELKPADKSGVQDAIDKAEEILDNSDQYTDEYIEKVNDALDNLYEILDEDLTIKDQDKVDNAIDAVDEIAENPSYVGANLDSLNAAIDAAEAKKAAPDYMNYTETSRQAFEAVLAEAIALRDSNPDITQQQAVEDMAARLNGMELSLEDADYSELDAAVAEAEALLADLDALKDQYTLTSIEALQNAVTEAGLVERDQDVSYQSVIDAAAQAVRDAIAGLTTYNRIDGISIAGGDRRDDDVIYYKVSWMKTYKSQPVTLHLEGLEGVDVASIKWEAANWSVDDPEATITDNGDGTATITPNGKGIGARSMWVKVTVTDVNGNVATDIVKVRFHKWDWQAK